MVRVRPRALHKTLPTFREISFTLVDGCRSARPRERMIFHSRGRHNCNNEREPVDARRRVLLAISR